MMNLYVIAFESCLLAHISHNNSKGGINVDGCFRAIWVRLERYEERSF
jgi:hypothetical protein